MTDTLKQLKGKELFLWISKGIYIKISMAELKRTIDHMKRNNIETHYLDIPDEVKLSQSSIAFISFKETAFSR